ncbi:MAG: hypothetical protein J1F20_01530 [Muribaculaceae bacterium]|nr:hypothetical protein [Muribaculaceae bacterium]
MKRRTIVFQAIMACLILAYVIVVVPMTLNAERNDTFNNIEINIADTEHSSFLTKNDVSNLLGSLGTNIKTARRKDINTLHIENFLNNCNRIETARCRILNDGTLQINVIPIDPVARIFDKEGSVYVNAVGKRVPARPAYHVDVPVVTTTTRADSALVQKLLPILSAIKANPQANALVSSLRVDERGDVIIIPNVVGHVINFGDTSLIDNKFKRLKVFYRDVMPKRGWETYDTISVKWAGRIVATKRDKSRPNTIPLDNLDDVDDEILNDEVMLTDT